jgi:hypothetical protein
MSWSFAANSQNLFGNKSKTQENIDIEDLIKIKKRNKKQMKILIDFKNKFPTTAEITVIRETPELYEILVTRKGTDDYTGGAENYELDKKSGTSKMIWHEHPMKIEILKE